jgi:ribosomal protein S6--L-glutamate ligase
VLGLAGSLPVVVKLLEGSAGTGVVLAETKKAAESLLAAFHQLDADFLVQGFVKEAEGRDLRALVVEGRVVAAMERKAAAGEFRANIHQGGEAAKVRLTPAERKAAVAAARAVGLSVAGVDLLRSESGPVVIEVNASPGLQGIESVSGVDVASRIVVFAERLLQGEAQHPSARSRRVS